MSEIVTVHDIIKGYLVANNFDGLFNEEYCACQLSDLFPCGECFDTCEPGYKTPCDGPYDDPDKSWCGGDCNFHVSSEKPRDLQNVSEDTGEEGTLAKNAGVATSKPIYRMERGIACRTSASANAVGSTL